MALDDGMRRFLGEGVASRSLDQVKSRRVNYLWRGYLARGKLTAIGGDPGAGKGTLGIDLAARLSRGITWPDGTPCPLGRAALLTGEDNAEDTIKPRCEAAGADVSRIRVIDGIPDGNARPRRIDLDGDQWALASAVSALDVDLLIIDPLDSYLGTNVNSWRNSDMRRILDPLAEAAAHHDLAVVLVAHLNKSGGGKALYRFSGSIASVGAARFAFLVAAHPDDPERRVLAATKTNLLHPPPSLTFRIVAEHVESVDDELGRIEWTGAVSLRADDLLAERKSNARSRAADFLLEVLADGPLPSEQIFAMAKERGVGRDSIWAARDDVRVVAKKLGLGAWVWTLAGPKAVDLRSGAFDHGSGAFEDSGSTRIIQDPSPQNDMPSPNMPCLPDSSRELLKAPKNPDIPRARARTKRCPLGLVCSRTTPDGLPTCCGHPLDLDDDPAPWTQPQ